MTETPATPAIAPRRASNWQPSPYDPPDHITIGATSHLVTVQSLAKNLRIPWKRASALLRALNIPILRLERKRYFAVWALDYVLFHLLRPGGPGFQAPQCYKKGLWREWTRVEPAWIGEISKDEAANWLYELAGTLQSGLSTQHIEQRLKKLGQFLDHMAADRREETLLVPQNSPRTPAPTCKHPQPVV